MPWPNLEETVRRANILVAIFAERDSHAAYYLREHGVTRSDAVTIAGAMQGPDDAQ